MSQNRSPSYLDDQFQVACDLKDQGRLADAQAILEQLVQDGLASADVLVLLGLLYRAQNLLPQAIETFKAATEAAPRSEIASLGLFHSYWDSNMADPAFEEIKRFQAIADCEDYRAIIKEINERW